MEGVIDEPRPEGLVVGYGNGTTALRLTGWVDQRQAEFGRVRSEAFRLVKDALDTAGIDMPSPEYRLALGGTPATPGATGATSGPPEAPARRESTRRPPDDAGVAGQRDVSVDESLDQQIEEERRRDQPDDLLE
jgi:small-conductance mechanosensitive channel